MIGENKSFGEVVACRTGSRSVDLYVEMWSNGFFLANFCSKGMPKFRQGL